MDSSNKFTTLDVRSIFILSSTLDLYLEVKIRATDRQYSLCLWIPRDKGHQDPATIDFNKPRRAQYLQSAWKKHQDAVFWVDINLALRKGLTFYQTRSNTIILQGTLPAYYISKVVRWKTGETLYEKVCMSPRPPPKISLRHDWTKELGSKVVQQPERTIAQQPEGEVARQAKFFQPAQPIPSPNCDRSGQPDITQDVKVVQNERKTYRSQGISVNSFNEELCSSERSGQPDITQDVISVQTRSSEDSKSFNVEQTDDGSRQLDKHIVAVQDDPEVYTHVNTNNIVMWVILPNNADWDCFKTPILQEIWKIQNPFLEEHCAYSEVIHLFQ